MDWRLRPHHRNDGLADIDDLAGSGRTVAINVRLADARLMAAAPDLLTWLEAHVTAFGECMCAHTPGTTCCDCRARTALRKAKGGSEAPKQGALETSPEGGPNANV